MTRISSTFGRSVWWSAVGTAWQLVSQVATLIILARLLGPREFGVVGTAMLIVQFLFAVGEFGLNAAVVQSRTSSRELIGTASLLSFCFGSAAAVMQWGLAPIFARFFAIPELESVLKVYCLAILIRSSWIVREGELQKALEFQKLAQIDRISYGVAYLGLSVGLAAAGLSYWALVGGHIAQEIVKGWLVWGCKGGWGGIHARAKEGRTLIKFGAGQVLARCGSLWAAQADSLVASAALGAGALGVYGRANQLATMPFHHLGQVLDKAIFPEFANLAREGTPRALGYQALLGLCWYLAVWIACIGIILAELIVLIFLGAGWHEVTIPLQILLLALPFRIIHKVSDPVARAAGVVYRRAWRQWLVAGFITIAAWALISRGLDGIAFAVLGAAILDALLMLPLAITGLCVAVLFGSAHTLVSIALGSRSGLNAFVTVGVAIVATAIFRRWLVPRELATVVLASRL